MCQVLNERLESPTSPNPQPWAPHYCVSLFSPPSAFLSPSEFYPLFSHMSNNSHHVFNFHPDPWQSSSEAESRAAASVRACQWDSAERGVEMLLIWPPAARERLEGQKCHNSVMCWWRFPLSLFFPLGALLFSTQKETASHPPTNPVTIIFFFFPVPLEIPRISYISCQTLFRSSFPSRTPVI